MPSPKACMSPFVRQITASALRFVSQNNCWYGLNGRARCDSYTRFAFVRQNGRSSAPSVVVKKMISGLSCFTALLSRFVARASVATLLASVAMRLWLFVANGTSSLTNPMLLSRLYSTGRSSLYTDTIVTSCPYFVESSLAFSDTMRSTPPFSAKSSTIYTIFIILSA